MCCPAVSVILITISINAIIDESGLIAEKSNTRKGMNMYRF